MTWLENPQTKDRAELGKSWKNHGSWVLPYFLDNQIFSMNLYPHVWLFQLQPPKEFERAACRNLCSTQLCNEQHVLAGKTVALCAECQATLHFDDGCGWSQGREDSQEPVQTVSGDVSGQCIL